MLEPVKTVNFYEMQIKHCPVSVTQMITLSFVRGSIGKGRLSVEGEENIHKNHRWEGGVRATESEWRQVKKKALSWLRGPGFFFSGFPRVVFVPSLSLAGTEKTAAAKEVRFLCKLLFPSSFCK